MKAYIQAPAYARPERPGTRGMDGNLGRMQRLIGRAWDRGTEPLYRNAFFIMSSSVLGGALGLPFILLATALYSSNDVGYATAIVSALSFIGTLGLLGLGVAIVRFLPETEDKSSVINTALTLVGILTVGIAVVFVIGVNVWLPSLGFILTSPLYVPAILAAALAIAFAPILDQVGFAARRAEISTVRTVVFGIARIAFLVGFASFALTRGRFGVFASMTLGFVIAVLVEGVLLIPWILPGYRPRPDFRVRQLRPMLSFSLGNYVATSIGALGGSGVPLLILSLLGSTGPSTQAVFYFSSGISSVLLIIPNATFTSFFAEASQKHASRHADERKAILLSLGLLVPGIVIMWILAGWLLALPGSTRVYATNGLEALRILIFTSIPAFLNGLLSTRIRIRKRSLPLIIASGISTSVTLSLAILLIPTMQANGAAFAVLVGAFAATPYYYGVARRSFRSEGDTPMAPVQM